MAWKSALKRKRKKNRKHFIYAQLFISFSSFFWVNAYARAKKHQQIQQQVNLLIKHKSLVCTWSATNNFFPHWEKCSVFMLRGQVNFPLIRKLISDQESYSSSSFSRPIKQISHKFRCHINNEHFKGKHGKFLQYSFHYFVLLIQAGFFYIQFYITIISRYQTAKKCMQCVYSLYLTYLLKKLLNECFHNQTSQPPSV